MNSAYIPIVRQKILEIRACLNELPDNEHLLDQLQALEDALDQVSDDLLEKV